MTPDSSKAGWVPAGCLLECNRPPGSGASRVQLSSIVSTSYPGHSLMDYTAGAGDEMSLVKDEMLRVFKRWVFVLAVICTASVDELFVFQSPQV